MEFIETPTFTRMITELLGNDAYRGLQNILIENPARGALIRGGGGIRNYVTHLREQAKAAVFVSSTGGTSTGIRFIY